MVLVWWFLLGLVAGAVARLIVPGHANLGCIGTALLGVLGSFVGGSLASAMFGDGFEVQTTGFIGSVLGAALLLVLGRVLGGGGGGGGRRFEDRLDARRR
jgi:uncharacterized membrane protein YeaQ/YmgE (transglycosylase-associated protein family)